MADIIETRWLYPPNWSGNLEGKTGWKRMVIQLLARFDTNTSGETGAKKIDLSDIRGPGGFVPSKIAIDKILYNISGLDHVTLSFDRSTNETISVLSGVGENDYTKAGGLCDQGEGSTGDVILTTEGAADGTSYDIVIEFRPKE